MATHPEFLIGHDLVPDAHVSLGVFIDDRRELLHLEPLWIETANRLQIGHRPVQIDLRKVKDESFAAGHAFTSADRSEETTRSFGVDLLGRFRSEPVGVSSGGSARWPVADRGWPS
jgi:hypothetical protein